MLENEIKQSMAKHEKNVGVSKTKVRFTTQKKTSPKKIIYVVIL